MQETVLTWLDGDLVDAGAASLAVRPLLVADSWLVLDGRVRALELHRSRFAAGVRRRVEGLSDSEVDAFWDAAMAMIGTAASTGTALFPRVEAVTTTGGAGLRLRLREAPERRRGITLWTSPVDPRTVPGTKGPDIPSLGRLRERAMRAGADEAVILESRGNVLDGSTTALLWWRGGVLVTPPATFTRVQSVTARSIATIAAALGTAVETEAVRPADLDGHEVWAVNALHGIRVVTRWVDGPSLAAEPGRADAWRRRLDVLAR